MAKKRVPISLRKPPSPESVEAFVRGELALSEGALAISAGAPSEAAEGAPESGPRAVQPSAEPQAQVGFEVFVGGEDGAVLRPVTVYLPAAFAEELAVYCAEVDRDPSRVIRDALETHFRKQLLPASSDDATPLAGEVASAPSMPNASVPFDVGPPRAGKGPFKEGSRAQRVAADVIDRALRALEVGQAFALRLRVQVRGG